MSRFYAGLEGIVGSPYPKVEAGMSRDHCDESDANKPFRTTNYRVQTTSRTEWYFVVDPEDGLRRREYTRAHTSAQLGTIALLS